MYSWVNLDKQTLWMAITIVVIFVLCAPNIVFIPTPPTLK